LVSINYVSKILKIQLLILSAKIKVFFKKHSLARIYFPEKHVGVETTPLKIALTFF